MIAHRLVFSFGGQKPPRLWWQQILRYVTAACIFTLALAFRCLILPVDAGLAFLTFYPALALTALLLGTGPALLVTALGGFAGYYLFTPPFAAFKAHYPALVALAAYLCAGSLISVVERRKSQDSESHKSLLAAIVNSSNEVIISTRLDGTITSWNLAAERLLGYAAAEMIGKSVNQIIPPERLDNLAIMLAQLGYGETVPSYQSVFIRRDGEPVSVSVNLAALRDQHGRITGLSKIAHDITAAAQAQEQLKIAACAFEAQEGIFIMDAARKILRVNRAFTELTGYSAAEATGQPAALLHSGRHEPDFYTQIIATLHATGAWAGEMWSQRKNGDIFPEWRTLTAVRAETGEITHYVGTMTDVTARKAAEDEIHQLAFYDPLTGLANRRLLHERLKHAFAGAARTGREAALLLIDLDHFKELNDTLGHGMGDLLLQNVAERLISCMRKCDTLARLGGDEFVVVLQELSPNVMEAAQQAEAAGEKILRCLRAPYHLGGHIYHSTPSIGASLFLERDISIELLLKRADVAMYQAKSAGGNMLRFFDPAMQAAIDARATLEADLRSGIAGGQFQLYYQPQVDAAGRTIGAEALLRWQHPQDGLVLPAAFMPLAEETGLILPLGQWVLESACRQLLLWARHKATAQLTVSVNVSARQFCQPNFVAQLLAVLMQTGADPRKLKLELTETMLLHNPDEAITKMLALKALGVSFSLDDFGTGYSSLSCLQRLPISQLKIDQSFVHGLLTDPNIAAIARSIITLGHSLGLNVIAEGVETEEQRSYLRSHGCPAFQGYLAGHPRPVHEFETAHAMAA